MILFQREVTIESGENGIALGRRLAYNLQRGDVIALFGAIGAGKTTLIKGMIAGLGISAPVTSPTFNILHIFDGAVPVFHFDLYRITPNTFAELGMSSYFSGNEIIFIEWADKAPSLTSKFTVAIALSISSDGTRHMRIEHH